MCLHNTRVKCVWLCILPSEAYGAYNISDIVCLNLGSVSGLLFYLFSISTSAKKKKCFVVENVLLILTPLGLVSKELSREVENDT